MKVYITLLLVLLLAVYTTQSDRPEKCPRFLTKRNYTVVEYYGRLTCSIKATWCAMIYYMEYDLFSANEDEDFIPVKCTNNHKLIHHKYVQFNGGDGDEDDYYYEPRIEIIHTCNNKPTGWNTRYEYDLDQVDMRYNVDYQEYKLDVAKKGYTRVGTHFTDHRYKAYINQDTQEATDFLESNLTALYKYPDIFDSYDEDIRYC